VLVVADDSELDAGLTAEARASTVGLIEARALEYNADSGKDFAQLARALRAGRQRSVGELRTTFASAVAARAFVLVT
jgi:hypothetical protein